MNRARRSLTRIQFVRELRGVSLEQMGEIVGVGKSSIHRFESGLRPASREMAEAIALWLADGFPPTRKDDLVDVFFDCEGYARVIPNPEATLGELLAILVDCFDDIEADAASRPRKEEAVA